MYNRWQRRIYNCILTSQLCQLSFVSDKIINNSDNFRIKWLSYSKISAIICVLYFLFLLFFYFILKNMSTVKLRYLTLATSCIEPLELDKLFGVYWCIYRVIHKEWDFRDDLYGLHAVYFHMFNQEQHKFRKKTQF